MLTPNPQASLLCKEKINSTTRLLAVTYTFKILNKFETGTTQKQIQENYLVKHKQLSLCLMGRKYLGRPLPANENLQMNRSRPQAQDKTKYQHTVSTIKFNIHLQQTEVRQVSGG